MSKFMNLQLFAEDNVTTTGDLEPAISVDFTSRIAANIAELQTVLGVTDMIPMNAGTTIKMYEMEQENTPDQVGEGEDIELTKINRKLVKTIEINLNKYRKQTTAEAIQKVGQAVAINDTDEKLVSGIQKDIKAEFYDTIAAGEGTAADGENLQDALAKAWAAVAKYFDDEDVTPIYFASIDDVADYLGSAQISMQTAFGISYVENFLGLGTLIVSPKVEAGNVIATAKENLNGAYVPASSGDVAQSFDLTADATGLVGMTHAKNTSNATVETLAMSGVVFYPEFLDGVFVAKMGK